MNTTGVFYVADNNAYYLARNSGDGHWRFVENGTETLRIQNNGYTYAPTAFSAPYFMGQVAGNWGGRNAGMLKCADTGNAIGFAWAVQSAGFNTVTWIIDNAVSGYVCTQTNAKNFGYAGGSGGPTGAALNGYDIVGNLYGTYVDALSDERIKENISLTEVDALAILQAMPVNSFDVRATAAAWIGSIGEMDMDVRKQRMREAKSEHVKIGLVAQSVKTLIPEAVNVTIQPDDVPDSPLPIDLHTIIQQNFTPYFVRAIQQLNTRLTNLESRA
jgi:hypothetical protein